MGGWVDGWLAGWVPRRLSHAYANLHLHLHPHLHLLSATRLYTVSCQASACIATATRETASPCAPQGSTPRTSSRPQAGVHACYSRVRALWRGQERLVSTYLSLGRGRKHVILLPPTVEVRATPPIAHPTPHTSPPPPHTHTSRRASDPRTWPRTPHVHSSHALLTCTPPVHSSQGAEIAERLGGDGCDSAYGRPSSQRAPMPVRPRPEVCQPQG